MWALSCRLALQALKLEPIVDVAEDDVLRLVFPVPESAVPHIKKGLPVKITVQALNETFGGKVDRFAEKVDRDTRTMQTEVDVPNPTGRLTPGMYASVGITLERRNNVLAIPLQALSFGKTTTVITLNKEGRLETQSVEVGLETPSLAEIKFGLAEGDLVLVGSRSSVQPGQRATGKLTEIIGSVQ